MLFAMNFLSIGGSGMCPGGFSTRTYGYSAGIYGPRTRTDSFSAGRLL
jgi:hypothetical protein